MGGVYSDYRELCLPSYNIGILDIVGTVLAICIILSPGGTICNSMTLACIFLAILLNVVNVIKSSETLSILKQLLPYIIFLASFSSMFKITEVTNYVLA